MIPSGVDGAPTTPTSSTAPPQTREKTPGQHPIDASAPLVGITLGLGCHVRRFAQRGVPGGRGEWRGSTGSR